jgi:flagella basal body P-ring formation protein FlgA
MSEQGFAFERRIKYVLEQIKQDYDKVWHWKDFPEKLPFGVLTDPQLIVGKTVINIIEAGTPMIGPGLKNEYVINFGQIVKISVGGSGFRINTEGKAMNSAVLGQNVQVKMASGQVINGIARSGGLVEVSR